MANDKRPGNSTDSEDLRAGVRRWPKPARALAAVFTLYAAAMAVFGFFVRSRLDWNEAGNFGDMFGAFSAFASGLGLIGVAIAILLQHEQFKMQRHELELQRRELRMHREELRLQRDEIAGSRHELAKQAYISALAARVSALSSLKGTGLMSGDLYETNLKLKGYIDQLAQDVSESAPRTPVPPA